MTMFNKDQIFQLLESRDGEALRALWQGRGAVDIAALLDSVEVMLKVVPNSPPA